MLELLQLFFWRFLFYTSRIRCSKIAWDLVTNVKGKRIVMVYAHTTKWDAFWFAVIHLAFNLPITSFMWHSFFEIPILGSWLTRLGFISVRPPKFNNPLSDQESEPQSQPGIIEQTVTILNDSSRFPKGFVFYISPQGGITSAEWKKGYYEIAKQTNSEIFIASFDYQHWALKITQVGIDPNTKSLAETERLLKAEMVSLPTLHLNNTNPLPVSTDPNYPLSSYYFDYCQVVFVLGSLSLYFYHSLIDFLCYIPFLTTHWLLVEYISQTHLIRRDRFWLTNSVLKFGYYPNIVVSPSYFQSLIYAHAVIISVLIFFDSLLIPWLIVASGVIIALNFSTLFK